MKLKLNNISVSFGINTVLNNVNFEVNNNEKIAIVGRNGCGKTTLLNVIMGLQEIDSNANGNKNAIEKIGNFKIGHLKQIAFDNDKNTLEEEILKVYSNIINLKNKIEAFEKQIENSVNPEDYNKYAKMQEEFDMLGGYTFKKEINLALKQFGFSEQDKNKCICEFSGGQQTKIALIKLLLSKPDLLILDEPTNHLDIFAIQWLENYLKEYKKSVIVVSHDRAFLDNFVNVVYEIERHKATRYVGNYSKFVQTKMQNYEKSLKEFNSYTEEKNRLQSLANRFRYKATKASMAQSKLKQIERMEQVESPEKFDVSVFHANPLPKTESGNEVLTVKDLKIGYNQVLSKISLKLLKGQRVGIIGGNGQGKSTFLKTLVEKTKPLGGKFCFGAGVEIGYFDQQTATNNIFDESVLNNYLRFYPNLSVEEARSDLGAFMFCKDDVFKNLKDLSGGELVRLEFCKIFKSRPNTLVLDEPTNHLDIVGKEALEDLLLKFKGTIIFVSHDRYFVNKLATSLLVFENGESTYYENTTYAEFLQQKQKEETEKQIITSSKPKQSANALVQEKTNAQISYARGKEENKKRVKIRKLESDIKLLEEEIKNLTQMYSSPSIFSDFKKVQEIDCLINQKKKLLEELENEWLLLSQ